MTRTTIAVAAVAAAILGIVLGLLLRPAASTGQAPAHARSTGPLPPVIQRPAATPSPPLASRPVSSPAPAEPTREAESDDPAEDSVCAAGAPERAGWAPAAAGFARNFTRVDDGAAAWRQRLDHYVVPAVREQIATVDLADVPRGRYASSEAVDCDPYQVAVQAFYAEGWSLVLYLIIDDGRWRVYRYDRFEQ